MYTLLLAFVMALFGMAVYFITRDTLLNEIDDSLRQFASSISQQTEAIVLENIPIPALPEEENIFDAAMLFAVIADTQTNVRYTSRNLGEYDRLLAPLDTSAENSFSMVTEEDHPLRVLSVPLSISSNQGEQVIGYLQVATLMDSYYTNLRRLRLTLMMTGFAAITLSLLLGILMTHRSLKTLDDISAIALQITRADDLGRRLPDTNRSDEVGRLTTALNITLERLERLFRTQQRFLADISHELRTPLTALRGNVDLMQRMGSADMESLDAMQQEMQRMSRLVDDLLFLARADSGGLPIQQMAVALDTLFLDVYRQALRMTRGVAVELLGVDQARVIGDPDRLKQVVLNLVDNAIKYTPAEGRVMLSLGKQDGLAKIVVEDTGAGIPAKDLPHIFDRFYRVDRARTRAAGGSGLGLSIAQWVVQAHSGWFEVDSQLGEGSRFTVWLPLAPEYEVEIEGVEMPASSRSERPRLRALANLSIKGD